MAMVESRGVRRGLRLVLLVVGSVGFEATGLAAHPMGNFSVGQYSALSVTAAGLKVRYVIDLAEVPTSGLLPDLGLSVGQPLTEPTAEEYRRRQAPEWCRRIAASLDGSPLILSPGVGSCTVTPGAGGLPTLRMETECVAAWPIRMATEGVAADATRRLDYRDDNYQDLVGLKEVIADCASGVRCLSSTVSRTDVSAALTRYSTDARMVPPRIREARVLFQIVPSHAAASAGSDPRVPAGAVPPGRPPGPGDGRFDSRSSSVPLALTGPVTDAVGSEVGSPTPVAVAVLAMVMLGAAVLGARLLRSAPTASRPD